MKPHFLRVISGPDKGRQFEIANGQTLKVGRGTASDTKINDPRVSRVHCRVLMKDGRATLTHEGGSNDTYVNGKPVSERPLKSGETFRVGDTVIRFDGGEKLRDASTIGGMPAYANLEGADFAHYKVGKLISRGRTGIVHKATDTKKNRDVALKVLLPTVSSTEEQQDRFVRAMQTMLPLRHPNIIPIYHAGKLSGRCWVAMEWIDGESMRDVIAREGIRNMLDWTKVWEVAVDIARALQHAGENNIIHRNLAPANIMCRKSDQVNLLGDLMLAKATEGNFSRDITSPGQMVGDVSYMSPERTYGDQPVDARSDIYELGATLYALLTGRPPFEAQSVVAQISMIREATPVAPKEYQISINDMFQDVVLNMLAKRPEDRFQSASALLKDLNRVGTFGGLSRD